MRNEAETHASAAYRRYITLVRGRARRILGDAAAAEDVAQDVFIRYLDHRARAEEQDTAAFLYQMTTRLALNRLRDRQRRQTLDETRQVSSAAGASPTPRLDDELFSLRQTLARVDEELMMIASYYYLDGLEQEEISVLTSLPRRTVGRRLEKFRESAKALLEEGASPKEVSDVR